MKEFFVIAFIFPSKVYFYGSVDSVAVVTSNIEQAKTYGKPEEAKNAINIHKLKNCYIEIIHV